MATTSTLSIFRLDGTINSIYCHQGGHLEDNGEILYLHFKESEKVKQIISFGSMITIGENISPLNGVIHSFNTRQPNTCFFYGRDKGDFNTESQSYYSLKDYINNLHSQDYDYIFHEKKEQWYLLNSNTQKLQKLSTLLLKEKNVSSNIKDMIIAEHFSVFLDEKLPQKNLTNHQKKKI